MTDIDETGAIDWFLIEFTGKELNGEPSRPCSTWSTVA